MMFEQVAALVLAALCLLQIVAGLRIPQKRVLALGMGFAGLGVSGWLFLTSPRTTIPVFTIQKQAEVSLSDDMRSAARSALALPGSSDNPEYAQADQAVSLPPHSWSEDQEETCRAALAAGRPCVVAESVPGMARAGLVLVIGSDSLRSVAYEFGFASERDIGALGAVGDEASRVSIEDVSSITRGLVPFEGESSVSSMIERLRGRLAGGGYFALRLDDEVANPDQLRRWRSFFALLGEEELWVADLRGLRERQAHGAKVASTVGGQDTVFFADQASYQAALTIVTPWKISGIRIDDVLAATDARDVGVYLLSPHAIRLVFDKLRTPAVVNSSAVMETMSQKELAWHIPSLRVLRLTLLLALISALCATLVQTLTSWKKEHGRAFWIESFATIFFVASFVFWLSLNRLSWDDKSPIQVPTSEETADTLFLDEWPEGWFAGAAGCESGLVLGAGLPVPTAQKTSGAAKEAVDKWITLYRSALGAAGRMGKGNLAILSPAFQDATVTSEGNKKLYLFDAQEARNWYFRRSQVYAAAMTGWTGVVRGVEGAEVTTDLGVVLSAPPQSAVLVLPDPRFLADGQLEQVTSWVKLGGTVASTFLPDFLADGQSDEQKLNADSWLTALQVKREMLRLSAYQRVTLPSGTVFEITTPHWTRMDARPDANWLTSTSFGEGRIFHVGFGPLLAAQQQVWRRFITGLRGGSFETVAWTGKGCATALGIVPWGASEALLDKWVSVASQAGVSWFWAIDGESLANIWSARGSDMKAQAVALLDHESVAAPAAKRYASAEVYRTALGKAPVFVGTRATGSLPGFEGSYLHALEWKDPWEQSLQEWQSTCSIRKAAPVRLVSGQNLGRLIDSIKDVKLVGPQSPERLAAIWLGLQKGEFKMKAILDPVQPLLWRLEGEVR